LRLLRRARLIQHRTFRLPCLTRHHRQRKRRRRRDYRHVTCFKCGKKGHIQAKCPDGEKRMRRKTINPERSWLISPRRQREAKNRTKSSSEVLYTVVFHNALASTGNSSENFDVDSGASDHLIPSRGDLHAYRNSRNLQRSQQLMVERPTLPFWDPASGNVSQWPGTGSRLTRRVLYTWSPCMTGVAREAGRPRMGRPPTRWRGGAAKSGWGPVYQYRKGEQRLSHSR
jgi:Zinc knuckle